MKSIAVLTMMVFTISAPLGIQASRAMDEQQFSTEQLGPDPLGGPPTSLAGLVNATPAAVIAEILNAGELRFEELPVPHSPKSTVRGYATYRVIVREVLFNRVGASGPPLKAGDEIEFTQQVGRESARAFLARQIPVAAGDECLLFLVLRPHGWGMLKWYVQFRNSRITQGVAEIVGQGSASDRSPDGWLTSVPMVIDRGVARPLWAHLVQEVRRLGKESRVP